jgi:hypothetical protein
MLCCDPNLGERFEGAHSCRSDGSDGNEDAGSEFVLVKVVGELAEMLDTNSGLRAKFHPNSPCGCYWIGVGLGRERRVEEVHFFSWAGLQAHEPSTVLTVSKVDAQARRLSRICDHLLGLSSLAIAKPLPERFSRHFHFRF